MKVKHGSINNKIEIIDASGTLEVKKNFKIDRKDGFIREVNFYNWCKLNNISQVPELIAVDEKNLTLFLKYIKGEKLEKANPMALNESFKFINDLNKNGKPFSMENAVEAITYPSDLINHINNRMRQVGCVGPYHPKKLAVMHCHVNKYLDKNPPIIGNYLISPSDLGMHNCILKNKLYFYDFEYSGIDSQLKLIMDYVFHPANGITKKEADLIAIQFANSLQWNSFEINYKIFGVFKFWWLLRTLNSISEKTINARKTRGVLLEKDCSNYVETRITMINEMRADFDEYFFG